MVLTLTDGRRDFCGWFGPDHLSKGREERESVAQPPALCAHTCSALCRADHRRDTEHEQSDDGDSRLARPPPSVAHPRFLAVPLYIEV